MREYDLITCPGPSCKHGYVGWRQCDYCDGMGKIFIPRPKPKHSNAWRWLLAAFALAIAMGLIVVLAGKP